MTPHWDRMPYKVGLKLGKWTPQNIMSPRSAASKQTAIFNAGEWRQCAGMGYNFYYDYKIYQKIFMKIYKYSDLEFYQN